MRNWRSGGLETGNRSRPGRGSPQFLPALPSCSQVPERRARAVRQADPLPSTVGRCVRRVRVDGRTGPAPRRTVATAREERAARAGRPRRSIESRRRVASSSRDVEPVSGVASSHRCACQPPEPRVRGVDCDGGTDRWHVGGPLAGLSTRPCTPPIMHIMTFSRWWDGTRLPQKSCSSGHAPISLNSSHVAVVLSRRLSCSSQRPPAAPVAPGEAPAPVMFTSTRSGRSAPDPSRSTRLRPW